MDTSVDGVSFGGEEGGESFMPPPRTFIDTEVRQLTLQLPIPVAPPETGPYLPRFGSLLPAAGSVDERARRILSDTENEFAKRDKAIQSANFSASETYESPKVEYDWIGLVANLEQDLKFKDTGTHKHQPVYGWRSGIGSSKGTLGCVFSSPAADMFGFIVRRALSNWNKVEELRKNRPDNWCKHSIYHLRGGLGMLEYIDQRLSSDPLTIPPGAFPEISHPGLHVLKHMFRGRLFEVVSEWAYEAYFVRTLREEGLEATAGHADKIYKHIVLAGEMFELAMRPPGCTIQSLRLSPEVVSYLELAPPVCYCAGSLFFQTSRMLNEVGERDMVAYEQKAEFMGKALYILASVTVEPHEVAELGRWISQVRSRARTGGTADDFLSSVSKGISPDTKDVYDTLFRAMYHLEQKLSQYSISFRDSSYATSTKSVDLIKPFLGDISNIRKTFGPLAFDPVRVGSCVGVYVTSTEDVPCEKEP